MMGQLSSGRERLFYSFNLENHIPANHLLRSIDQCLDLSDCSITSPISTARLGVLRLIPN